MAGHQCHWLLSQLVSQLWFLDNIFFQKLKFCKFVTMIYICPLRNQCQEWLEELVVWTACHSYVQLKVDHILCETLPWRPKALCPLRGTLQWGLMAYLSARAYWLGFEPGTSRLRDHCFTIAPPCNNTRNNRSIIIQIMNGYEFNSANIFMSWKINILFNEASAELNRINVNLSTNENISTIEWMKNIHYLFYTTSKKI